MSTTKKALVFLAITFAISWGVTLGGVPLGFNKTPTGAFIALVCMMMGPAIAATICAFAFERGHVREALGLKWTPNLWWVGAWIAGLLLAAGSIAFTLAFTDNKLTEIGEATIRQVTAMVGAEQADGLRAIPYLGLLVIAQSVFMGALINAPILTFSEELGWRGYLHTLWRGAGFWKASLATGAIWGLWHAPAIYFYGLNYPDNRLIGIPIFIVFCTLLGPLMTLIRDRGRSVIAAGIIHGTINAVAGVASLALDGPAFPWAGVVGIGGFLTLLVFVIAIALFTSRSGQAPAPSAATAH